ncbi:MAG: SH3 domain-containing protein [Methylobacter sp.]|nr:SH3 domain-containing protein [Methylobacter sp.]MDP2429800.1 SH3 domain-containing protein [Methylobacter sp.]MDP3055520.1 SH3 domain-containing protein [Methylobacter sp.]MDP3363394.1 SH3 domain-containing protein [Methylobacter sp.]MDZ4220444.1 SH3 domain-containing protein [Methylobacter sp.]
MQRLLKISVMVLLVPVTALAASLNIQVEEGQIRSTPSFFGEIVDKVIYGEAVELVKEQGAWRMVNTPRKPGWIHQSAVSASKVELVPGSQVSAGASGKEIALAGKGFNADVENAYKAKNQQINFAWVDKMEKYTVDTAELQQFIQQGGLRGAGL